MKDDLILIPMVIVALLLVAITVLPTKRKDTSKEIEIENLKDSTLINKHQKSWNYTNIQN